MYQCPEEAIRSEERQAGLWFLSGTRFGPRFHAHLSTAQENSGKPKTLVKQHGRQLELDQDRELISADGPPGTGGLAISASVAADMALQGEEGEMK
jgi:MinD superfamily P-loop ATPase